MGTVDNMHCCQCGEGIETIRNILNLCDPQGFNPYIEWHECALLVVYHDLCNHCSFDLNLYLCTELRRQFPGYQLYVVPGVLGMVTHHLVEDLRLTPYHSKDWVTDQGNAALSAVFLCADSEESPFSVWASGLNLHGICCRSPTCKDHFPPNLSDEGWNPNHFYDRHEIQSWYGDGGLMKMQGIAWVYEIPGTQVYRWWLVFEIVGANRRNFTWAGGAMSHLGKV